MNGLFAFNLSLLFFFFIAIFFLFFLDLIFQPHRITYAHTTYNPIPPETIYTVFTFSFYGCIDKTTIQVYCLAVMGFTFTETLASPWPVNLLYHVYEAPLILSSHSSDLDLLPYPPPLSLLLREISIFINCMPTNCILSYWLPK